MQKPNTNLSMSANNANDTPGKSLASSELENLFSDDDLSMVVIMGAHVLFPKDANLAQVSAVRDFFSNLVDAKIMEKIDGLHATN